MSNVAWVAEAGTVGTQKKCPIVRAVTQEDPLEKIGTMNVTKNGIVAILVKIGRVDHMVKIGMLGLLATHLFITVGAPLECGIHLHISLCLLDLGCLRGIDLPLDLVSPPGRGMVLEEICSHGKGQHLEHPHGGKDKVIIPHGKEFLHGRDVDRAPQDLEHPLGRDRDPEFPHGRDLGLTLLVLVHPHGKDLDLTTKALVPHPRGRDLLLFPSDLGFLHGINLAPLLQVFLFLLAVLITGQPILHPLPRHLSPPSLTSTSQLASWCPWFE